MKGLSSFIDPWICDRIGTAPSADTVTALRAFQAKALGRTLARAKEKSAFYRRHLAGIRTRDIAGPADLAGLPFTRPSDLRADPGGFLCLSQGEVDRIFTLDTSGTTARPKRICFTRTDLDLTRSFFSAALKGLMAPGERGMIFFPGTTPLSAGELIANAMADAGGTPEVFGLITDLGAAADRVRRVNPSLIIGMPTAVLALGEYLGSSNGTCIETVILTGDYVSPALSDRVARLFGCRTISQYGLTETGFACAIQCGAGQGLHIRHPHLIVEIVDPVTGNPLPEGAFGEVVVTTLDREAMPLIRYRTGDVSRILDGPCACGSPFPRLDRVRNRQTEGLALGDGLFLTMPDLDDALFPLPGVWDFTASLADGPGGAVLNLGVLGAAMVDSEDICKGLKRSFVFRAALDKNRIVPGEIRCHPWNFENTYVGKRLIRDARTRPDQREGFFDEVL